MAEDILPPMPPGEQKPVLKEKKKGFLGGLFGKKTQEKKEGTQPAQTTSTLTQKPGAPIPTGLTNEVPDNINLENIRKQLGLDSFSEEIPEPPQMASEQKKTAFLKKEEFELPDIEAAIASSKVEQPVIFEESIVEEPSKILPMEIKPEGKKSDKKQLGKEKPKKGVDDWTQDIEEKEIPEQESEFSKDLNLLKEQPDRTEKKEFVQEINPEEIKQTAKELKRKKFEEKKGISYEPEVIISPKPEEKSEFLVDAAPEDEIKNIKNRLLQKIGKEELVESKPQPLVQEEEKEAAKVIEEEPELPDISEEKPMGGKLSILENEPFDQPEEKKDEAEEKTERPSFIETKPQAKKEEENSVYNSELIKEMEKNLVEKVRTEEKARVEKEFEQERTIFEKEKQALEQEKIAVAGKASRYDFKEKQLKRDKAELEAEKAKLKRDKEEAGDLLKKLPVMRKDYETLNGRMNEVYETLKKYSKKEAELGEIEKNIELNKKALSEAQQRLEETEQKIKEKGFSQYLETELKEEPLVSHKLEEEQDITRASNLEIYNLIDECKTKVRDRNLSEAKKLYMKIREAYNTVNVQGTEKDLLYTAVRELYDDIKLAEMESNDFNFEKY